MRRKQPAAHLRVLQDAEGRQHVHGCATQEGSHMLTQDTMQERINTDLPPDALTAAGQPDAGHQGRAASAQRDS